MKKKNIIKMIFKNLLILLILIPLILYCNKTFATTTMTISANFDNSTISSGNEAVINIAIDKLDGAGEGVNAYIFTLNFNTDEFEFVKAEGQNNWNSPTYNETNINTGKSKFTATRQSFIKETGNVAKITLKAKKDFNSSNKPTVKISDISFAAKVDNKIQKVELSDIEIALANSQTKSGKIAGKINNAKQNNDGQINNNEDKGTSRGNNSTISTRQSISSNKSTVTLPNAGLESQIWIAVLCVLIINLLVIYIKYKKIYKYI